MSAEYRRIDWASDRLARLSWADEEERIMKRIDRARTKKSKKNNRKNHRNYA